MDFVNRLCKTDKEMEFKNRGLWEAFFGVTQDHGVSLGFIIFSSK